MSATTVASAVAREPANFSDLVQGLTGWFKHNIRAAIISAIIGGLFGWFVNVLLMMFTYEGYQYRGGFATTQGNAAGGMFIWTVLSTLLFGLGGYWRAVGTERFFREIATFPQTLGKLLTADGQAARIHLLWGAALTLLASQLVSPAIGAVVAVSVLVALPSVLGRLLSSLLFRAWSTIIGRFAPGRKQIIAGPLTMMVGLLGTCIALAAGYFISSAILKDLIAVGCIVFALVQGNRGRPTPAQATLLLVSFMLLGLGQGAILLADDGGWAEQSGDHNLINWLRSPGAATLIGNGFLGGIAASLGGALGATLGGFLGGGPTDTGGGEGPRTGQPGTGTVGDGTPSEPATGTPSEPVEQGSPAVPVGGPTDAGELPPEPEPVSPRQPGTAGEPVGAGAGEGEPGDGEVPPVDAGDGEGAGEGEEPGDDEVPPVEAGGDEGTGEGEEEPGDDEVPPVEGGDGEGAGEGEEPGDDEVPPVEAGGDEEGAGEDEEPGDDEQPEGEEEPEEEEEGDGEEEGEGEEEPTGPSEEELAQAAARREEETKKQKDKLTKFANTMIDSVDDPERQKFWRDFLARNSGDIEKLAAAARAIAKQTQGANELAAADALAEAALEQAKMDAAAAIAAGGRTAGTMVENLFLPGTKGAITGFVYGAAGNWDKGLGGMVKNGAIDAAGNVIGGVIGQKTKDFGTLGRLATDTLSGAGVAAGSAAARGESKEDIEKAALTGGVSSGIGSAFGQASEWLGKKIPALGAERDPLYRPAPGGSSTAPAGEPEVPATRPPPEAEAPASGAAGRGGAVESAESVPQVPTTPTGAPRGERPEAVPGSPREPGPAEPVSAGTEPPNKSGAEPSTTPTSDEPVGQVPTKPTGEVPAEPTTQGRGESPTQPTEKTPTESPGETPGQPTGKSETESPNEPTTAKSDSPQKGDKPSETPPDKPAATADGEKPAPDGTATGEKTPAKPPTEEEITKAIADRKASEKNVIPIEEQSPVIQDLAKTKVTENGKDYVDPQKALEQLTDTASSRTGKQAPTDVKEAIINTREDKLYKPADAATIDKVSQKPEVKELIGDDGKLVMDSFQTPGKTGRSLGADRDARLVVEHPDGSRTEVPRKYWENEAYKDFHDHTSQLYPEGVPPDLQAKIDKRVDEMSHLKGTPEKPGLTDEQIRDRAWADEHNQLFTDKHHVEASADNSDQWNKFSKPEKGPVVAEQAQTKPSVIEAQSGDRTLKDPEGYARMWQEKSHFYEHNPPEALAQSQKGIAEMMKLRGGYREGGLEPPPLPPKVAQAMDVVLKAPVGVDATPAAIAQVNKQLTDLGFRDMHDAMSKIAGQNELLKWSKPIPQ